MGAALLATATFLSACASTAPDAEGGAAATTVSSEPAPPSEAREESYLDVIEDAATDLYAQLRVVEPLEVRAAAGETELLADVAAEIEAVRAVVDENGARLEATSVPGEYAADHAFLLDWLEELRLLLDEQEAAAASGDLPGYLERLAELSEHQEVLGREMSGPVGRILFGARLLREQADLEPEEAAFLRDVQSAQEGFRARNAEFGRALAQNYAGSQALLEALRDAGAGTAYEEVRANALELEPPTSMAADHRRWLGFLDEAVLFDAEIAVAAAEGDIVAFVEANERLGMAAVMTRLGVSEAFAAAAFGADPFVVPGGDYGREVERLLASIDSLVALPRPLAFFPVMTESERVRAVALVTPVHDAALETIGGELSALEPPEELVDDHLLLVEFVEQLRAHLAEAGELATIGDAPASEAVLALVFDTWCDTGSGLSPAGLAIASSAFPPPELAADCPA